jgi:hypothetical protein
MWNGTGMNWIDPSGWGIVVLRDERQAEEPAEEGAE